MSNTGMTRARFTTAMVMAREIDGLYQAEAATARHMEGLYRAEVEAAFRLDDVDGDAGCRCGRDDKLNEAARMSAGG